MIADASDYYAVLGLARQASLSQIKHAYRKLARECHPDHHPGDHEREERFKLITEAYEVLRDPLLRIDYDRRGASPFHRAGRGGWTAGTTAPSSDDPLLSLLHLFHAYKAESRPRARDADGQRKNR